MSRSVDDDDDEEVGVFGCLGCCLCILAAVGTAALCVKIWRWGMS